MHIRQLHRRELETLLRELNRRWLEASAPGLLELPEFPDGRVLVADEDGEPRALLGLRFDAGCGERSRRAVISVLVVDPVHAHRGIASLLVRFAEGIVRLHGGSRLSVEPHLEGWCEGRCWAALGYDEPDGGLSKPLGTPALQRCR